MLPQLGLIAIDIHAPGIEQPLAVIRVSRVSSMDVVRMFLGDELAFPSSGYAHSRVGLNKHHKEPYDQSKGWLRLGPRAKARCGYVHDSKSTQAVEHQNQVRCGHLANGVSHLESCVWS